jgi:hypothetical protein
MNKNKIPPPENCNFSNGKLTVGLEKFDHLSESLLLNYQDAQFYLTISLDPYSFHTLMSQETHKNDWPTYDVDLTRTSVNEQLGITFVETMFLNQNEVAVHKLTPNSLASNASVSIEIFDILVTINGTKITSLKQAHKIIQKSIGIIKLQFQRPVIKFKNENKSQTVKMRQSNSVASNLDIVSILMNFIFELTLF